MTKFTRESRLGDHFTPRPLSEFVEPQPFVEQQLNKYADLNQAELLERILAHRKWRHHHGIAELESRDDLYAAYVRRVDEMLDIVGDALSANGYKELLLEGRVADLAASEGFVTHKLVKWGANAVDAYEVAENGLDRFSLLWNYLGLASQAEARLFRFDLEQVHWSAQLAQKYDVVFCLGIIYHLENPMLFARNLFDATNHVCVVESDTPRFAEPHRFRENGVVYLNKDQVTINPGEVRKLMEFRPDREALIDILLSAGFSAVEVLEPESAREGSYFASGEKSVLLCTK